MPEGPGELRALQELAEAADARAARARAHATVAREQARQEEESGDDWAAEIHRREAIAHERAAKATAATAALYRQHIVRQESLGEWGANERHRSPTSRPSRGR